MPKVADVETKPLTSDVTICIPSGAPHRTPASGAVRALGPRHPTPGLPHRAGRLEAWHSFSNPGPSGHRGGCPTTLHSPGPWPQQTLGESGRRGRRAGSPGVGHGQGQTNPAGWAGTGWASFHLRAPPLQEVVTLLLAPRTAWGNEQRGQGSAVACSEARPRLPSAFPLHQSMEIRMWSSDGG